MLAEIKERQHAVQDLEQSLLELLQIFQDMAVLVDAQSELLDNVQKQVSKRACWEFGNGGSWLRFTSPGIDNGFSPFVHTQLIPDDVH